MNSAHGVQDFGSGSLCLRPHSGSGGGGEDSIVQSTVLYCDSQSLLPGPCIYIYTYMYVHAYALLLVCLKIFSVGRFARSLILGR